MASDSIFAQPRQIHSLSDCWFYHFMDLPGIGEVGDQWDLRPTIDSYLGHVDFARKRVLDLGAASGFLTFTMEARGARVVSFDMVDPSHWNIVPFQDPHLQIGAKFSKFAANWQRIVNSYWFAHRVLGSKAQVYYGDVYNLPDTLGSFDIVVIGMILPHLRDPFQALVSACNRCSETIVLTQQAPGGDQPYAYFMPNVRVDPDGEEAHFAWWVMSERCLTNMLEVLGFDVVSAERTQHRCLARVSHQEECLTLVAKRRVARRVDNACIVPA